MSVGVECKTVARCLYHVKGCEENAQNEGQDDTRELESGGILGLLRLEFRWLFVECGIGRLASARRAILAADAVAFLVVALFAWGLHQFGEGHGWRGSVVRADNSERSVFRCRLPFAARGTGF